MKGFWIPEELMELDISWTKRILLAEISQLEMLDKGCIASNSHFAEKLKLSNQAVSKALNELAKESLISIDNAQTKRNFGRKITINFSKSDIHKSKSSINFSKSSINFSKSDIHKSKSSINFSKSSINFSKSDIHKSGETKGEIQSNKTKSKSLTINHQVIHHLPDWLDKQAWEKWVSYRIEIKKKLTSLMIKEQISFLSKHIHNHVEIINASIMNGWQGLFELKNHNSQQPKSFKQQDKEAIDSSIDNYYRMKEQGFNLQEELIKQAELEKKEIYMSLTKQELSKAIVSSLKIDANAFNYETINEAIDLVPVERYMEFYKQILKVDTYGNGIKAVLEISEMFKTERTDNLLVGTHEQAKAMYDKFYYECCAMLDYTQKDRNKTPNDREFFKNMPYSELKRTDGTKTYSKQELYVLNALGGGEWLLGIRLALSSKEIIDKIEKIIKEAVLTKYNNQSQIESKRVQNLIGGIKR